MFLCASFQLLRDAPELLQEIARGCFDHVAAGGHRQEHVEELVSRALVAVCLEREMFSKPFTSKGEDLALRQFWRIVLHELASLRTDSDGGCH